MADGMAMSDKILRTLVEILNSDPNLEEFAIVPTEDNSRNKSPVLYEAHNVGLESWCVKHVYNYASSILFNHKELLSKQKLTSTKTEYLNIILIGALLINPDVGTFWNMKRALVEQGALNMERELHFSKIVLTYKSKCNEVFSYRRWILKRILGKISESDTQAPMNILQNEFGVIHAASERSPNNYHSWNHRIWCMENLACRYPGIGDIVYSELNYSQEWINSHVSEHSGYHYRQYLLKLVRSHKDIVLVYESFYNFTIKHLNLINDGEFSNLLVYLLGKQTRRGPLEETNSYINYISMLFYDLFVLVDKLNKVFPEHESLFYHRRFLVYHLFKLAYDYHGIDFQKANHSSISPSGVQNYLESNIATRFKSSNSEKSPLNKAQSCQMYLLVLNTERQFIALNTNTSCSVVQAELAKRHQQWLKYVMGEE